MIAGEYTICQRTSFSEDMASSFELRSATLDIMARALRIATKYEIMELRQWCKQQLCMRWPPKVVDMTTTAMPNAAGQ